jgi:tRNA threonylcarbamoyladenosine biosynthesis protein TsaB
MNNYLLHLETATKVCSVAISLNGEVLSLKESSKDGYIHSESLTLFIEEVLVDAGITLQDLSAISVSAGPGSYTGLRIGLSTAKGLCFALNIPLISIDTLDALYHLIQNNQLNVIPLLDARRMEVYSKVYDCNGKVLEKLDSVIVDANSFSSFEPFIVLGDGASKCKEIWTERNIIWEETVLASAAGQAKIAFQKFIEKTFENLAYFVPIYLKDANGVRR